MNKKKLFVICGPTAIGKTNFAIELANKLNTEIISADSRQFYIEMNIGTAKPSSEELNAAKHHFINNISINDYYNVYKYEIEAINLINILFQKYDNLILVGGSGLYINAVCNGIDELPDPDLKLRTELDDIYKLQGISPIQEILKQLDPEYYNQIDINNYNRVQRAIEIIKNTGLKISQVRTKTSKNRNFNIIKIGLTTERASLYNKINLRVDSMIQNNLISEALQLYPLKHLNSLNTVGYKELFAHFDGECSLEQAIINIKTNSRRYAKRQYTWFNRDLSIQWFQNNDYNSIFQSIIKI